LDRKEAIELDKYYTKEITALLCYEKLKQYILSQNLTLSSVIFIEPSAGNGRFLDVINEAKIGYDIAPEHPEVIKRNFLTHKIMSNAAKEILLACKKQFITIGNPPFGTKASLAIQFINKSLTLGNIVGFIVPIQFRKWSAQSKINPEANLVIDIDLPENSFTLLDKDYNLRCCFQIWSLLPTQTNLRITEKPKTEHSDFKLYQYNRTTEAEKFFDYDWDFAVPRQGYLDYTFKAYSKEQCDKKQQWIFFKAKDILILEKLKALDFVKLSLKNSGIPGFGKADVVEEYNKICQQ